MINIKMKIMIGIKLKIKKSLLMKIQSVQFIVKQLRSDAQRTLKQKERKEQVFIVQSILKTIYIIINGTIVLD